VYFTLSFSFSSSIKSSPNGLSCIYAAPSNILSLTLRAKLKTSSYKLYGSLKLISIPKHIEKSLYSNSAFFDIIIATQRNSRLLNEFPFVWSKLCLKEPAKMKSQMSKHVSILYSLDKTHLSHLVKCNSGITSFLAKCL